LLQQRDVYPKQRNNNKFHPTGYLSAGSDGGMQLKSVKVTDVRNVTEILYKSQY